MVRYIFAWIPLEALGLYVYGYNLNNMFENQFQAQNPYRPLKTITYFRMCLKLYYQSLCAKRFIICSICKVSNLITTFLQVLHILHVHCLLHVPLCFGSPQVNSVCTQTIRASSKCSLGFPSKPINNTVEPIIKDEKIEAQGGSTNCKDHRV